MNNLIEIIKLYITISEQETQLLNKAVDKKIYKKMRQFSLKEKYRRKSILLQKDACDSFIM